jgi:acyl-CoA reductase-like NAD-dependent aldehyde dehydrogenase
LAELIQQAGLPAGWVQVALLNNENAEKLVTDPRVAFFSFIGSAKVGWYP